MERGRDGPRSPRVDLAEDDALAVQAIKPVPDKVDLVEFHPVEPWIAYKTRNNTVAIWDHHSDQLVYVNHFGGTDEAALTDQAVESRSANVLSSKGGAGPSQPVREAALGAKSTASGDVKAIAFLDMDVIYWTLARQMSQSEGCFDGSNLPSLDRARRRLGNRRWLVVACENKIVAHDLNSAEVIDLPRGVLLDGKAPTCLSLLLCNSPALLKETAAREGVRAEWLPLLAVGTASGTTFVISFDKFKVHAKLAGAHKGAVSTLLTIPGKAAGLPDRLVTGGVDGNIAVWDPSSTPARGAENEVAAVTSFKAHDGGVNGLAYGTLPGDGATGVQFRLASVGEDRCVCVWDGISYRVRSREQPLGKSSCNTIDFLIGGELAVGTGPCLVATSKDTPVVLGHHPVTGQHTVLLDLTSVIDSGHKKTPKVYGAAVHPVKSHLFAVATNTGIALLSSDSSVIPPVVAIPSGVMNIDTKDDEASQVGRGSKSALGYLYVSAFSNSLVASAVQMEATKVEGRAERNVKLTVPGAPALIAQLAEATCPLLSASPSGRSIAAVWPESKRYSVYTLSAGGQWIPVDEGKATQLAWSSISPAYAVLTTPTVEVIQLRKSRGIFGRKKESDNIVNVTADASVVIHAIDEEQGRQQVISVDVIQAAGVRLLHGGALLGVVRQSDYDRDAVLQFYSWTTFEPVGPELPDPLWISWEPECTLVALAYHQSVEICRLHPKFERFSTIPIADSTAGLWQSRQLVVATPTSLHMIFADPLLGFTQSLVLASLAGTSLANVLLLDDSSSELPVQQLRPPGPVNICGIRHSYLWLADYLGRPFLISLRHPGVRFRCLVARGELDDARRLAEKFLPQEHHDSAARFMVAMEGDNAIDEALKLPGLSPALEFSLRAQAFQWDEAAETFLVMALGLEDRSLLRLGLRTMPTTTDVAPVIEAETSEAATAAADEEDDRPDLVAQILDEAARMDGSRPFQLVAEEGEDDSGSDSESDSDGEADFAVDWDAALLYQEGFAADAEQQASRSNRVVVDVDPGSARRYARQGLDFANRAIEASKQGAARTVLGAIVLLSRELTADLLQELVVKLGVCRMTESACVLAEMIVEHGTPALRDPAVAVPLTALVGGKNSTIVQRVLRAAGLAPLAAVHGAVWGGTNPAPLIQEWSDALSAVDPVGARLAVVPPTV